MARWMWTLLFAGLLVGCGGKGEPVAEEPATPDEAVLDAHDDEVSRLIKVGKDDVRACGMAEETGGDTLVGKLQVSFEIKEDGSVGTVTVDENATGDQAVGTCVTSVIAGWSFPAHPANEAVQFTYPFEVGPEI
jgi:hypothetical protein